MISTNIAADILYQTVQYTAHMNDKTHKFLREMCYKEISAGYNAAYHTKVLENLPNHYAFTSGRKYYKITWRNSPVLMINKETGDVYKPSDIKTVCYNILDEVSRNELYLDTKPD